MEKTKIYTYPIGKQEAYAGTQVKNTEILRPIEITEPSAGTYVFNYGKNITGIAELKVQGPKGTKVQLQFGEILKSDGHIQTENLRKAGATGTYILIGEGRQPMLTLVKAACTLGRCSLDTLP